MPSPLAVTAWIAHALYRCRTVDVADVESLRGLLAVADWINHATPSHAELILALTELRARGLLTVRRSKVTLAPAARRFIDGRVGKALAHRKAWDAVEALLASHPPRNGRRAPSPPPLPTEDVAAAALRAHLTA